VYHNPLVAIALSVGFFVCSMWTERLTKHDENPLNQAVLVLATAASAVGFFVFFLLVFVWMFEDIQHQPY
jgi:hypothetical protein